jgi:non-ribosomal peptide synthetase component F
LTETTICSTVHRLGAEDFESSQPIPIGRPMTGHRLYVLNLSAACEVYVAPWKLERGILGSGTKML